MNDRTPYNPKPDVEGINSDNKSSPLKDVTILLSGFLALLFVFYFSFGLISDWALGHLSVQSEIKFLGQFWNKSSESGKSLKNTDAFLEKLSNHVDFPLHLTVICEESPNAFALPGAQILITSGLLKKIKSENGLMFVIGHEVGHIANRDHIRGLGRQIILATSSALIGFSDLGKLSSLNFLVTRTYNRDQERSADQFGLNLLEKIYGHSNGAEEFFEIIDEKQASWKSKIESLTSTHPATSERIEMIRRTQKSEGHSVQVPSAPFAELAKEWGCS